MRQYHLILIKWKYKVITSQVIKQASYCTARNSITLQFMKHLLQNKIFHINNNSYLKLATFEMASGLRAFLKCDSGVQFTLYKFRETGVGGILAPTSENSSNTSGLDACICKKNKV
jgi:hypothetical protein